MKLEPTTLRGNLLKIGFGQAASTTVRVILSELEAGSGEFCPALLLSPAPDDPRAFVIYFADKESFDTFAKELEKIPAVMADLWKEYLKDETKQ